MGHRPGTTKSALRLPNESGRKWAEMNENGGEIRNFQGASFFAQVIHVCCHLFIH